MAIIDSARNRAPQASDRDLLANARDRRARDRDVEAEERDREAEAEAETVAHSGWSTEIDLRDGRNLKVVRHQAAAEREQAAADRADAAADREQSSLDREVAFCERSDADEEREILRKDGLTGLLQRGAGISALEREAARSARSREHFVVVFIDVDGLKRINDEHGHRAGDEVLRRLGEVLQAGLRSYDLAFRYGGDEFVCILPGVGNDEAEARFRVVRAALASGPVPVSVTIGVAEWRPDEDTDDLLARADSALYDARREVEPTV